MKANLAKTVRKLDNSVAHNGKDKHPHFPAAVDRVFKWAPALSVFVLDTRGIKMKNDFKNHLLITASAECLMNAVLKPVKSSVHRWRPNYTADKKSFPSGHTATAFLGAEILRHELGDRYKVLSYSGYLAALAAGSLRVYNNKHWLSDVVAGAALGFVAAKLTYELLKKIKKEIQ